MRYFVMYNGKCMKAYKSLTCALNLVRRKGWQDDFDNDLYITDSKGDCYNPLNGVKRNGIFY